MSKRGVFQYVEFFIKKRLFYYVVGVVVSIPALALGCSPMLLVFFYACVVEAGMQCASEYYQFRRKEYQNLYKYREKVNLDPSVEGAWNAEKHIVWYGVALYIFILYGILADTASFSFFMPALITWGVLCGIHYLMFVPKKVNRGELQDRRRFYEDVNQEEREQQIVETIVSELDKKRSSHTSLNPSSRRPNPPYLNRQKNINK